MHKKHYSLMLVLVLLIIHGCSRFEPSVDETPEGRYLAVWDMRWDESNSIEKLIRGLKDKENSIRWASAESLGYLNILADENADEVVPALVSALNDKEWFVRLSALWSLYDYGPYAKEAVPSIVLACKDPRWEVREVAAKAIAKIDPFARQAIPILQDTVKTETNEKVRQAIKNSLYILGSKVE